MVAVQSSRRTVVAERISDRAQHLTDEHGLDGFTMDDLARESGVSRRTLFNYFPGKVDAVLGVWPRMDPSDVEQFRAGGPRRDLLEDLRTLVLPVLTVHVADRDVVERGRRMLLANPRLVAAVHARYLATSAEIVGHIAVREGEQFADLRARVAVTLLVAIFDAALDDYLTDPLRRPITVHFDESLRTARSLLGR